MHTTAMKYGREFFEKYGAPGWKIVEIGSQEVEGQGQREGALRQAAPERSEYIGVDMAAGLGVDVVADDPYSLPFNYGMADAVVSSSTFEHVDFFWLTFLEMCRICKPGGYIYLNSPSNGPVHRHPVDCWRFYPDAAQALTKWADYGGYQLEVVETFIGEPDPDRAHWEDWVCVWRKR